MASKRVLEVTAHLFWFTPELGTLKDLREKSSQAAVKFYGQTVKAKFLGQPFRLEDLDWDAGKKRLSGVLYKERTTRFPSELGDTKGKAIRVSSTSAIGFPTCFVYDPGLHVVAVQYEHSGARASCLPSFMNKIGFDQPFQMDVVFARKAASRLKKSKIIRSYEYKMTNEVQVTDKELKSLDIGAEHAVEIMKAAKARWVRVEVSVGHAPRSKKLDGPIKSALKKMSKWGDCVDALRLGMKEGEESPVEVVDLLNDKFAEVIQVKEGTGRRISAPDCIRNLDKLLDRKKLFLRDHPDKPQLS